MFPSQISCILAKPFYDCYFYSFLYLPNYKIMISCDLFSAYYPISCHAHKITMLKNESYINLTFFWLVNKKQPVSVSQNEY